MLRDSSSSCIWNGQGGYRKSYFGQKRDSNIIRNIKSEAGGLFASLFLLNQKNL